MQGINQMQVDEKRGFTFAEGLKAALRHDPDYLLLGEIRDAVSAATALEAAGTGRVVLSTMHSRDVAGAVTALRNFGLGNHEIATALAYVVAQRLVRKLCPECRRREAPTESETRWLHALGEESPESVSHAAGCPRCRQSGYCGRAGVFEISPADAAFYDLVLSGADEHKLRRGLHEKGGRTLLQQGLALVRDGITDIAELRTMGAQTFLDRVPPEAKM
jgi:type II secretory ATPase GspE/PulE/Tfp pilus assembly ATPase PilB-like protein